MSRFWLTYCDLSGRPLGVLVLDSWSLSGARLRASVEGLDRGARFCQGHELEGDSSTLIPPAAVGRMLDLEELGQIIRTIERWIPKRAAAASVSRRGTVKTRATWTGSREARDTAEDGDGPAVASGDEETEA